MKRPKRKSSKNDESRWPPLVSEDPPISDVYFGEEQLDQVITGYRGREAAEELKAKLSRERQPGDLPMTPGQASAAGQVLSIDHRLGGKRYAAHLFDVDGGGIAWVNHGWSDYGASQPLHMERGKVVAGPGKGWLLISPKQGDITILPVDGEPDGSRKRARELLESQFRLKLAHW